MKFRKKPVVIEARQLTPENAEEIGAWCEAMLCKHDTYSSYLWGYALNVNARTLRIPTLEGDMSADMGDWIIQGVKGEFYPCKPDIFEMTYEPAE
jgi:hypothetical protein